MANVNSRGRYMAAVILVEGRERKVGLLAPVNVMADTLVVCDREYHMVEVYQSDVGVERRLMAEGVTGRLGDLVRVD